MSDIRCPMSDVSCLTSDAHLWSQIVNKIKCSTCRFALSFLCVISLLRSVVSSPRCRRFLVSICHSFRRFVSSMFRFVVSFRLFHRASLGTRKSIIRPGIAWSSWLSGLYGDLRQSVQFIFNRLNEQFDEWEWSKLSHYTFWQSDIYSFTSFFVVLRSHRVEKHSCLTDAELHHAM